MLPCNPLLALGQLGVVRKAQLVLWVVFASEIGQDGGALHDGELAVVVVDKHRNAAIGAEVGEPLLLLNVLHDGDGLEDIVWLAVGLLQFLEDNGGFVAC